MSWYGFSFTIELLVQLSLFLFLYIIFAKFFEPRRFRLRIRARYRIFWKQDLLFKIGLLGTFLIFITVFIIFGFEHCIENGQCETKFVRLIQSSPSEVGDTLAGVSSALAFLWIILTVMMQSKELKAQRTELEMTRREHQGQRRISEENLRTLMHDSQLRDQQEAWRLFEALLYEFLYAIEWHREGRVFCRWLFGESGRKPTKKQGSELIELALDLHFQIRKRKKVVASGKPWKGPDTRLKWNDLLGRLDELIVLGDSLAASGKAQLRISRLVKTRKFIQDAAKNPKAWANQEAWTS